MGVKAVMYGLLLETEDHKKQLKEGIEKMGFKAPRVLGQWKTLPGQGGEGGRNDVLVEFDDNDIPRLAVNSLHLCGGFSWHDDYIENNREIIPTEAFELMRDKIHE